MDSRGLRELLQFAQRVLGVACVTLVRDVDQDRASVFGDHLTRPVDARELFLETEDELLGVHVEALIGEWPDRAVGRLARVAAPAFLGRLTGRRRDAMPVVDPGRRARRRVETDRGDQVEPQPRQVDDVIAGQRLIAQMRVDQAQTAKSSRAPTQTADVGEQELRRVTDDDVVDVPRAIDEHSDLPTGRVRDLRERTGELVGGQLVERDAAPIDALKGLRLGRAQARCVPMDFRQTLLVSAAVPQE